MKSLNRLLTLFVYALLLATGLGVLLLVVIPGQWEAACRMMSASRLSGAGIGLLLFCIGLLLVMSEVPSRRRNKFLSFSNDEGAVNISTEAISEYLCKLLPEFPSIVKMAPVVEPRRRKIDIVVDIRIKAGNQLHEICEVLQKRVRESMENGLGIRDVRNVIVRVTQISSEHKTA